MPMEAATSTYSGIDMDRPEKMHGQFPSYVLEEAGQTLSRADAMKKDGKLMKAASEHHEHKSKHHKEMSRMLKHHMKRGLVSEEAAKKAMGHGSAPERAKHAGTRSHPKEKEHGDRTKHAEAKEHGTR